MREPLDLRSGPDLPSHLTLEELRLVLVFCEKFAAEADLRGDEAEVGIIVRDRGREGKWLPAVWVEFSVAGRQFALWRYNGDLYEVGPDGAVGEDPIHQRDAS